MPAHPGQHVGDVALRCCGSADLLDANVVHVEDAIALEDAADGVDAPDLVGEGVAAAQPLDDVDVALQRRTETKDDDVPGCRWRRFGGHDRVSGFGRNAGARGLAPNR